VAASQVGHPPWCGKGCDAGREGGKHRGAAVRVDGVKGRLATVWLEQVGDGPVAVGHAGIWPLPPEDALRVAEAIGRVAGAVVGERV